MAADQDFWQQSSANLTCEMICHRGSGKPPAILCSTEPLNTTSLQFLRIIATSLQAAYENRLLACSITLYTYAFLMRVFSPFFTALLPFLMCVCSFFSFFSHIETLLHAQIEEAGNFFSFIFFLLWKWLVRIVISVKVTLKNRTSRKGLDLLRSKQPLKGSYPNH